MKCIFFLSNKAPLLSKNYYYHEYIDCSLFGLNLVYTVLLLEIHTWINPPLNTKPFWYQTKHVCCLKLT